GRVRRLSRVRRHQSTVQMQDPGALLRSPPGHGLLVPWSHAGGRSSHHRFTRHRLWRDRSVTKRRPSMQANKKLRLRGGAFPTQASVTVVDDGLATRPVVMLFFDHRRAVAGLAFLYDRGAITVTIGRPSDRNARTHRADMHANIIRHRRRSDGNHRCGSQDILFHSVDPPASLSIWKMPQASALFPRNPIA